jgi:hypothetical protein
LSNTLRDIFPDNSEEELLNALEKSDYDIEEAVTKVLKQDEEGT